MPHTATNHPKQKSQKHTELQFKKKKTLGTKLSKGMKGPYDETIKH